MNTSTPPPGGRSCGPSGAHRWLTCPGSVDLSRGVDSRESSYAAEGQEAHDYAEAYLRNRFGIEVDGKVPEVPADNVHDVSLYTDTVEQIFDSFPKKPNVYIEEHIESKQIDEFGGTIDALIAGVRNDVAPRIHHRPEIRTRHRGRSQRQPTALVVHAVGPGTVVCQRSR